MINSDTGGLWHPWSEEDGWSSFLDINQADSDDDDTDSADSEYDSAMVSAVGLWWCFAFRTPTGGVDV